MHVSIADEGGRRTVELRGPWTIAQVAELEREVTAAPVGSAQAVSIDGSGIEAIDLTGGWMLRALERRLAEDGAQITG